MQCPCQSGKTYTDCCFPYHDGKPAPTAEALMRSRYSAYALHIPVYLYRTWDAQNRPSKQDLKKSPPLDWIGLQIVRTEAGSEQDDQGVVEFIARYRDDAGEHQLHEVSEFRRDKSGWVYVSGQHTGGA